MNKPLLVLVDGSAVFHRGYHAIPHLTNREGLPTNAVYGFLTIMIKVLSTLKPDYVVVAWDKSSKTFRKDLFADYKATRQAMPEELRQQIPTTKELVAALGLPWVEVDDYEADDIIGTLAAMAKAQGKVTTVIATGDRDQLQLINDSTVVDMFNPRGLEPTRYDMAKMQDKYGLTPDQFIDYKALVGDASDNIPGVKGIGDKGAQKLLSDYGSLDGIYSHLDQIEGRVHDLLVVGRDMAFLSQRLSAIVCDLPLTLDLETARVGRYDRHQLDDLFRRLDFRHQLLSKLPGMAEVQVPRGARAGRPPQLFDESGHIEPALRPHLEQATYKVITDESSLAALVGQLTHQQVFAFDTETTSVNTIEATLVGLSISFQEGVAWYIPVGHKDGLQLPRDAVLRALAPIFADPKIGKVGHNVKFDYEVLRRHGVVTRGIVFDTMVAAFLLNPIGRSQSLDGLAFHELGVEMIPISDLIGSGKSEICFDETAMDDAVIYAAEDADMSWRLYQRLRRQLDERGELNDFGWSLKRLGQEIEWPLVPVLGEMELTGIALDPNVLAKLSTQIVHRIAELKEQIYVLAGEEFNLGSPLQLGQILYGRLGLSTVGRRRGKTGWSTAAAELEKLRDSHPIISLIMEYRELDKLKGTYTDALPAQVASDGRVHTNFSQTIAQTGRLSSTSPNLQNIPVRTELGRKIRDAFVAAPGRVLVSGDYSQIELRVAAALSGDEGMVQTFRSGIDLHQQTAAELFGLELDAVTKAQRSAAKTINFGVLYGMSAHGLSVATGMDGKEAAAFIDRYFAVRPRLKHYIESTKQFARDFGYTETLFGRRRPCPDVRSNNFQVRQAAERVAVNVPIQGTAADIYKLAMIAVARALNGQSHLLLQIHDELIVEAPEDQAMLTEQLLAQVMSDVIDIGVPLAVDTAAGRNWGQL